VIDGNNNVVGSYQILVSDITSSKWNGGNTKDITLSTLVEGAYSLKVALMDSAGNLGTASTTALSMTVDTTIASLSGKTLDMLSTSDTGVSDTDNITSDRTPTITISTLNGIAMEVGDTIQIIDTTNSNAVVGSYTVLAGDLTNGLWNGASKHHVNEQFSEWRTWLAG
jgi:hypothetical protein